MPMLKPERITGCEPILRALFDVQAGEERVLDRRRPEGLTPSWQSLASFCRRYADRPSRPAAGHRGASLDPMPSKVLLINANRCTRPDPVFPLGLTHLSAALRRAGHSIAWLDRLANMDRLEEVVDGYRPDVVGISLRNIDDVLINKRETFFDDAVSLGARLRQKARCPIIVGGSGFSLFPEQLAGAGRRGFRRLRRRRTGPGQR